MKRDTWSLNMGYQKGKVREHVKGPYDHPYNDSGFGGGTGLSFCRNLT